MKLELEVQEISFILEVLQTQPLPFVRTAPLINKIGQQAQEQQAQAEEAKAE